MQQRNHIYTRIVSTTTPFLLYEEKYLLLQISWYRQTEVALVWLGLVVTGVPEIRSGQTIITHNCLMSFKRMRALLTRKWNVDVQGFPGMDLPGMHILHADACLVISDSRGDIFVSFPDNFFLVLLGNFLWFGDNYGTTASTNQRGGGNQTENVISDVNWALTQSHQRSHKIK